MARGNTIAWLKIKITQNLDSQKKRSHRAPICFYPKHKVPHGNNIPRGHIKITHNLDSQKKKLHWILAPRTYNLRGQMISHGDRS